MMQIVLNTFRQIVTRLIKLLVTETDEKRCLNLGLAAALGCGLQAWLEGPRRGWRDCKGPFVGGGSMPGSHSRVLNASIQHPCPSQPGRTGTFHFAAGR